MQDLRSDTEMAVQLLSVRAEERKRLLRLRIGAWVIAMCVENWFYNIVGVELNL
jgi:hypothetical protein